MKRGHREKERRRNDAIERAKTPTIFKRPLGLREKVRLGLVDINEAIELALGYNENIRGWLARRKKANIKPKIKQSSGKKKKGDKKKNVQKDRKIS